MIKMTKIGLVNLDMSHPARIHEKRSAFFSILPYAIFYNGLHSEEDINYTVNAVDEALKVIKESNKYKL
jgi:hypothetical protein